MKIRKSFIVAAVALIAVVLTAVYAKTIGKSSGKPAGVGGRGGRGGNSAVVSVRTMTAEITTLHGYVNTNGEVESQNSVSVYPDMGGKVISTSVMLGSSVKKNDIIAYVDPSEPGTNYRSSPVYAPISGSVISTPLKNGKKVTTSTAIAIIGDINNLQVTANVPERYVAVLKKGLKAEVSVEAYPGVIFEATVSRVSPVVDATTRTKEVILTFDRHDERINAGMFAKVKLYTSKYSGKLVVPSDAIITNDDDVSYLFVVNDDYTVSRRTVKTGKAIDGMIQVTDNLMAGERVVYEGMLSLSDGANVNDLAKPKPAGDKK